MRYSLLCLGMAWALCVASTAVAQDLNVPGDRECAPVISSDRLECRLLGDDEAPDLPRLKPPRNIIPLRPAGAATASRTTYAAAELNEWTVLFEHESGLSLAIASASDGWMAFGLIPTCRGEKRRYTLLCTEDRLSLCALDRGEKWEAHALGLAWLNGTKRMFTAVASMTSARGFRSCAAGLIRCVQEAVDSSPYAAAHRTSTRAGIVCDLLAIASSMLRPRETAVEAIEFGPFGPSSLQTYVTWESNRFADRRLELESSAADCRNSLDRNRPFTSLAKFIAADGLWSEIVASPGTADAGLRCRQD